MRVGAAAPPVHEPSSTPVAHTSREVELERTRTSRAEIRAALGRAEEARTGRPARAPLLDILTAQASLETDSGRSMFNFNFGGIKGTSPSGMTASARTHEWENGVRVRTRANFRAYGSLDEGAQDYLSLLHRRYAPAVAEAERGNVDGFTHALHQGGYFTTPELRYGNDMRALLGLPARPDDGSTSAGVGSPGASDGSTFSTTEQLARLLDAVSVSAARIAAPEEDAG